ncbi:MAG: SCO family protein [Tepidisphaeraceae bacterium]|jgi:protein SCO1/2
MSKPQKIITIILWIVAVGGMVGVVAMKTLPVNSNPNSQAAGFASGAAGFVSTDAPSSPPPILDPAPSFTLTDQDGNPATNAQLLGHPWIADFIFTTCASLCPTMSAHMSELQDRLPADVLLVSFSVDPTHDTPAVLKEYAAKYHAQPNRWIFLTGDEKTQQRVIRAMKLGFAPAVGDTPIQHDEHFVLIDAQGKLRGYYDSFVPQRMDALVHDAKTLSAHPTGAGQ